MIRSYLPALVFIGLGTILGLVFAVVNSFVGPRTRTRPSTVDPYECGLPSEVKQNFRFGISFYLIAMLFILFDIEVIFLYPVAIQLDAFGTFALVETIVVLVGVVVGGLDRLWTATLGGFAIGFATGVINGALPTDKTVFLPSAVFALVILVLLVRPGGLFARGGSGGVERV